MVEKVLDFIFVTILSLFFSLNICFENLSLVVFIMCFIISEIFFYIVWNKISNLNLKAKKGKILKPEFIIYEILIIGVLIFALISYYPGYTTYDTLNQYNQALNNTYSNWHPVIHTLLLYKIPQLFTKNIALSTIFQISIISVILMYFCYWLRKNFLDFKYTLFVLIIIIFNPLFIKYSVALWKDILYSWFFFLEILFLINIIRTDGEWLKKHKNKFIFILAGLGILYFRHNGIVPFCLIFILLSIYFAKYRKFLIISFVTIIISMLLITNPIYRLFKIDYKTGGKSEMIGEVMGQISYYLCNGADFSNSELNTLNNVVPLDNWYYHYSPKTFNYIKLSVENYKENAEKNFNDLMKIWFKKSIKYPSMYIASFENITESIWHIEQSFIELDYISSESKPQSNNLKDVSLYYLSRYNEIITKYPFRWLFQANGEGLFIIMFSLFIIIKKTLCKFKYYIPFIVILSNTLVIMFMITGGECRFSYPQVVTCIPLLIYSLFINQKNIE